jgi:hypothetical protein
MVVRSTSFSERDFAKAFKMALEKQKYVLIDKPSGKVHETSFKVYLNKRIPTNSKKFQQFWLEQGLDIKDLPPSQPEIDITFKQPFLFMI